MNKFVTGQTIKPWVDPRIRVSASPIEGQGMFARQPIKAGEVVIIWGGTIFTAAEINAGLAKSGTAAKIGDTLYLADDNGEGDAADYYLNHSCDPNVWLQDEISLVARREIDSGEELTADYALWETDPLWAIAPCRCGQQLCRGKVTGNDWQLTVLQARYRGHFTPYLNEQILGWGGGDSHPLP